MKPGKKCFWKTIFPIGRTGSGRFLLNKKTVIFFPFSSYFLSYFLWIHINERNIYIIRRINLLCYMLARRWYWKKALVHLPKKIYLSCILWTRISTREKKHGQPIAIFRITIIENNKKIVIFLVVFTFFFYLSLKKQNFIW